MYNAQGQKVGECVAGYDWHPIGAEASVDWFLNYCVEVAKSEGSEIHSVSDDSVLHKDYSYPLHPSGENWTKKLAWDAYWSDTICADQYGYIVAELENVFFLTSQSIESQLKSGQITKQKHKQLVAKAELVFHGE